MIDIAVSAQCAISLSKQSIKNGWEVKNENSPFVAVNGETGESFTIALVKRGIDLHVTVIYMRDNNINKAAFSCEASKVKFQYAISKLLADWHANNAEVSGLAPRKG